MNLILSFRLKERLHLAMDKDQYIKELEHKVDFLEHYRKIAFGSFGPADADIERMIIVDYEKDGKTAPQEYDPREEE